MTKFEVGDKVRIFDSIIDSDDGEFTGIISGILDSTVDLRHCGFNDTVYVVNFEGVDLYYDAEDIELCASSRLVKERKRING